MNGDSTFVLKSGMFSTCSGVWDEKTKTYDKADVTDVSKCCIKQCIEPVNFCYNYCKDNAGLEKIFNSPEKLDRCFKTCSKQRFICLGTCSLNSHDVDNYLKCSQELGCKGGAGNYPSKDCIAKNRESIYQCCRKSCIPKHDLNCERNCKFFESIMLQTDDMAGIPLLQEESRSSITNTFKTYPDKTLVYILTGIFFSLIIILIWFLTKRK
jgi:hypothetical protein